MTQQKADGSIEPEGRLHTGGLDRSKSSKMSSTCFIAWSLLQSDYDDIDKIDKRSLGIIPRIYGTYILNYL